MEFRYCQEKNAKLIAERGLGFEEIIVEISNGNLLSIVEHPNKKDYPNQKILQVRCLNQVYLIPFVIESDGKLFLKTIYPSRKAKRKLIPK